MPVLSYKLVILVNELFSSFVKVAEDLKKKKSHLSYCKQIAKHMETLTAHFEGAFETYVAGLKPV